MADNRGPPRARRPAGPAASNRRLAGRGLVSPGWLGAVLLTLLLATAAPSPAAGDDEATLLERLAARTRLEKLAASDGEGRRIRLTYYVPARVAVFWHFKTDFDNDWLVTNQYIEAHRFIARRGNRVLTETRYTYGPDAVFRWETELQPENHTLRYTLLNPEECGQAYNRGVITLTPDGDLTRVTHTSHFDFSGAFLWAHLPGPWGMADFFRYTARWEQETIMRLASRYTE